jgi:hypothetical protein
MASSSLVFLITNKTLDNETRLARLTTLFQKNPFLTDPPGESPIAMAVESRCTLEIVRFLIDQGCPVDKKTAKHTPLSLVVADPINSPKYTDRFHPAIGKARRSSMGSVSVPWKES